MPYEIRHRQMEIPELDAFLEEYRALCQKHGIQFSCEDYDYDGGHYTTIAAFSDGSFYLNMDEADGSIPFIARVKEEAERLNEEKYATDREKTRIDNERREAAAVKRALEDGVVVGGKKYKLTPLADD
jgi:hypothetical protein